MRRAAHDHAGAGLWIGLALGVPIMLWGVRGILIDSNLTHPAELGRWLVGSAIVHDAVLLPIVVTAAVLARRVTPMRAWPWVRFALAATGVVALVSWPFVRGYGRSAGNPSLLPRNYAAGVAVALLVVWALVGLVLAAAAWRSRRTSPVSR